MTRSSRHSAAVFLSDSNWSKDGLVWHFKVPNTLCWLIEPASVQHVGLSAVPSHTSRCCSVWLSAIEVLPLPVFCHTSVWVFVFFHFHDVGSVTTTHLHLGCFYPPVVVTCHLEWNLPPLASYPRWIFITWDHSLCPAAQQDRAVVNSAGSICQAACLAQVQALEFHLALTRGGMFGTECWAELTVVHSQPEHVNTDIDGRKAFKWINQSLSVYHKVLHRYNGEAIIKWMNKCKNIS